MDVIYIINFIFLIVLTIVFWKIFFYFCRNFRFIETLRYVLDRVFEKFFGKHN